MFRHASHRLVHPPIVTLDFLLPSRSSRSTSTNWYAPVYAQTRGVSSARTVRSALFSSPVKSTNRHASSQGAPVEDKPALGSAWNLETLFHETYPRIVSALEAGQIALAGESWSALGESSLLPFLGPSHYSELCKLVAHVIAKADEKAVTWGPTESSVIDEIALYTATNGDPRGLIARMNSLVRRADADAVLRLFWKYNAQLQEKSARLDILPEEPTSTVDALLLDENAHDTESFFFPPSIACHAIAAFALKGSFAEAVKAVLSTNAVLTASFIRTFFASFQADPALRAKAETYARRIVTARLLSRPVSLQRHVSNLSKDRSDKNLLQLYEHLVGALKEPQPWLTMDPMAVSEQTPVLLPDFAWSILLRAFLHCRRLDLAERLWKDMTDLGVRPTMDVWTSLLDGYAELRMADRALVAWGLLCKEGPRPSMMAYRALIYGLFNSGRPDTALEIFQEFRKLLKQGAYSADDPAVMIVYNTVIYWLLINSRESDAQAVLQQMEESGPKPDVVSFNTFMRYYANQKQPGAIGAIMQKMHAAGVEPDSVTYSTILTALLPVEKDAARVVRMVTQSLGQHMNVVTNTTIISHFIQQETDAGLDAALELLRLMEGEEDESLRPNEVTYTTILAGIHRRRKWLDPRLQEEYVRRLTERMKRRDLMHSKVTYNMLIKACLENPSPDGLRHAMKYYREMVRRNVPVRDDTWYLLLSGLARRRAWEEADGIVEEIEKSGRVISTWLGRAIRAVREREDGRRPKQRTVVNHILNGR